MRKLLVLILPGILFTGCIGCVYEHDNPTFGKRDDGHDWYYYRAGEYGSTIPVHSPDCKKCERRTKEWMAEVVDSLFNMQD